MTVDLAKSDLSRTLKIEESARKRIEEMELHASRVYGTWGHIKPEYVLKMEVSFRHVLARITSFGGTLSRDGQLGLFLSSGMSIGIVPFPIVHTDWAPEDLPSVGAYPSGTPYLGQICWARPTGDYCLMPVRDGQPTCTHMADPMIMGTPIPVEWSMHS